MKYPDASRKPGLVDFWITRVFSSQLLQESLDVSSTTKKIPKIIIEKNSISLKSTLNSKSLVHYSCTGFPVREKFLEISHLTEN